MKRNYTVEKAARSRLILQYCSPVDFSEATPKAYFPEPRLLVGGQGSCFVLDAALAPLGVLVCHRCSFEGALCSLEFHQMMVSGEVLETVAYRVSQGLKSVFVEVSFIALMNRVCSIRVSP